MSDWSTYVHPPEDPAVAVIEEILAAAASRGPKARPLGDGRAAVTHALGICACETMWWAPTWLIHDVPGDGLVWRRVPDGIEWSDLVDAQFTAGGHADPDQVLRWLQGEAPDPWCYGSGGGDWVALEELGRGIGPDVGGRR